MLFKREVLFLRKGQLGTRALGHPLSMRRSGRLLSSCALLCGAPKMLAATTASALMNAGRLMRVVPSGVCFFLW